MRFLQSTGRFRRLDSWKGTLYLAGTCNISDADLLRSFNSGKFPNNLRGNHALVWIDSGGDWAAAVDHLATIPLFYSNETITDQFLTLCESQADLEEDTVFLRIREMCGELTIGPRTPWLQLKRLEPCCMIQNGYQTKYLDLNDIACDSRDNRRAVQQAVESSFEKNLRDRNTLLLSSGTDSVTLAAIAHRLGVKNRFTYLHVYSHKSPTSEKATVERIAKDMQLQVRYHRSDYSGDIVPEISARHYALWMDNPFPSKRLAVTSEELADTRIYCGELGDQLWGGVMFAPLLRYAAQTDILRLDDVVNIWLNYRCSFGSSHELEQNAKLQRIIAEPGGAEAYDEIRAWFAEFYSTDRSDLLAGFRTWNLLTRGPFELMAAAQDDLDWFVPFADWEVVRECLSTHSSFFMPGGKVKHLQWSIWGEFASRIPWEKQKNGYGIPARDKIKA
jgi:asparagine synthetase B (glutamine-hydrolysing)